MSFFNSAQLSLLERFLDLSVTRQSLISSNIANVDTPGYHTRDIDFRGEMARVMQGDPSGQTEPFVREVPGLIERPDGNNVSIDREGLLLSEVQLQFSEASQLITDEFKTLNMAINEGSSSRVVPDQTPAVRRFEPGHPDADADGYVSYPAINPVEEMVNLMGAARAYQLNASAVQSTKNMIQASIDIIKS